MSFRVLVIAVLVMLVVNGLLAAHPAQERQARFVLPKETDSEITTDLDPHYVVLKRSVPARNQLFLFLPGTRGKPQNCQQIVNTAADLGFHAIGLNYPNDQPVNGPTLCGGTNTDLDCYAKVRLEIKDGIDRTPLLNITRANSIENRLIKLLIYLHTRFPNEGWGQYLDKDLTIKWSSIVVSGHSQGGGHAGIIGRYHPVARVVMFASMDYNARVGRPANWIAQPSSTPNATPPERFYGFSHQRDEGVNFTILSTQVWPAFGMDKFGPVVNVDKTAPPYQNSHMLTSNLDAPTGNYHGCIVVDRNLILLPDGTPVYKPVWEYLLGATPKRTRATTDSPSQPCPLDENTVMTDKGCVRGESLGAVNVFRGIPYAAPPVKELRWKAPQEHPSWEGVREATRFGKSCPQLPGTILRYQLETDEDCLSLNIWTPKTDPSAKLPVMVWIHGGGLVQGSSAQQVNHRATYDGRFLAERFNVVIVTINYRLGQLGFLAHSALSAESEQNVSGNYGLLDQIFALRWVQKNIQNFGGDPTNVTIFGESAGGKSVCALLASPVARGLFHRAIIQSGGCPLNLRRLRDSPGRESAEAQGERFARAIGCANAPDVLACLRSKTIREILNTLPGEASIISTAENWDFIVDGYALPDSPGRALESGNFYLVPLIAGTTGNEASIFTLSLNIQTVAQYEAYVRSLFRGLANQVLALYPAAPYPSPKAALDALLSDVFFVCPTRRFVRDVSQYQPKTFLYHFTYVTRAAAQAGLGAFHGSEIPFVFGNAANPTPQERALSNSMMTYWTSFAKTGDPNEGKLPTWPAYTLSEDPHLQLDIPIRADKNLRKPYCDFWERLQTP
ncbi:MAG: carboxylesterase family protein [Candidatus Bipolaricaulota bacterium]|nr:carboxylesterase family protein [Candidatus Bipolaricaulota bacterium]MCS7274099.1 carboxylesterase family protein [Candidatus Bipolaricaulota bacterium]MDW8328446.1 carboxylesterase/lipase family protein [Candidatus Bipolaricaulota bacterium]